MLRTEIPAKKKNKKKNSEQGSKFNVIQFNVKAKLEIQLQLSMAHFDSKVSITTIGHNLHDKLLFGSDAAKNKTHFVFYCSKGKHVWFVIGTLTRIVYFRQI